MFTIKSTTMVNNYVLWQHHLTHHFKLRYNNNLQEIVAFAALSTSESTNAALKIKPANGQQSIIYIMHIVDDWGSRNHLDSWEEK